MNDELVIEVTAVDPEGNEVRETVTSVKEYHTKLILWYRKDYTNIGTLINGVLIDPNNAKDEMLIYNNLPSE